MNEQPTPAEIVAESRARQGLPRHIADVAALDRLACLIDVPTTAMSAVPAVSAGVGAADIGAAGLRSQQDGPADPTTDTTQAANQ